MTKSVLSVPWMLWLQIPQLYIVTRIGPRGDVYK